MKTAPSDTPISSSLASAIGPTAAMALPPQMAVPALIRNADFLSDMKEIAESEAHQHRRGDADGRVEKAGTSGVKNFMQVHAKAQGNHRSLQQKFRQTFAFAHEKDGLL